MPPIINFVGCIFMAMRIPIYFIIKGSGQYGPDGIEYVMILEVKLSRACASLAAQNYDGATIIKMIADKEVPILPI